MFCFPIKLSGQTVLVFPVDLPCPPFQRFLRALGFAVVLAWPAVTLATISHSMLLRDPKMNAKRFAGNFEEFRFEFHAEIQPVDEFLQRRRGDCDDYAILADQVLSRRNFTTMLVHVRLAGMVTHAVCYVHEDRAYLDYNNRKIFFTLSRSNGSLRDIATKVADSLEATWTSASSFTYSYETDQKKMVRTIVKTDPPETDDEPGKSPDSRLLVQ
jgi:hypothetical protein